ncbi:MAG: hypothetical protein AB1497_03520 [Bacillota bacterium]
MKQIIGGKVYDTEKARLVSSDHYWDGSNWERSGRNTFLYKRAKGNFFLHCTTRWQGERDRIQPVSKEEAKYWFEQLPEHELEYEDVFGEAPEEA